MVDFEKVEKLVQKANVSYEDAKNALEAANGDMLDAIIALEKAGKVNSQASFTTTSPESSPYKDVPAIHPSGSSNAVTLCSWTGNITHGQDGTGSINVVAHFDGSSNVNYLPRIFDVTIGTKSLTTIPRKSTLTITPTTLDNSDRDPAVNITVNGASNTFTDKVEWRWRKKGGSWSGWINIPISNELGSNTYPLTLVQGGVPLSLYQVGNSTGVSLMGSPVDGPGFYVHDKGPFVLKTITIGGNTYQVLAKE